MVPLIRQCVENHMSYVKKIIDNDITENEMKALVSKYALDIVGSCAFGLDLKVYDDSKNEFFEMAKSLTYSTPLRRIIYVLEFFIPGIKSIFKIKKDKRADFFCNLVSNVIKMREDTLSARRDFMDLMIELRKEGKAIKRINDAILEIEINNEMITSQAFLFFVAGFEATSSSIAYILYELALHPDIQSRLYKEISSVSDKYNGVLEFEALADMTYFNMVFYEAVRKNANPFYLSRVASSDYMLPEENLLIEKGTLVLISYGGVNKNPEYWENPDEFNPENFSVENMKNKPQCSEIIFSAGPRNCLGTRFAELQNMLYIAEFLKNFKVEACSKTVKSLEFDPKYISTTKHGIWIKILRRDSNE
ncbi:hypothetical protein K1T71_001228 [Dendrolimus kikuchii]|uniref:Uncharacterized protein n=1 Tax=Dendrolimus kikuchii TaxID=765133 RepID=A0ACC1DI14_9NEOP|nr:hypothetical protein K1T71_001228 [Dendrolimus kikuchii]